jgi:hypothetical protein
MYAVETPARYWSRYVSLAPYHLPASPGWHGELELSTLKRILQRLTGPRTRGFVWHVRFDHESLAAGLTSLGFQAQRSSTYVLYLNRNYEEIFAGYSATIRNHVRKARRRAVRVRDAHVLADVRAYYEVHMRLVRQKQQTGHYGYVYPIELLIELFKLDGTARLLVAEWEGQIVGGGLFLRDGCSVYYFHGASDRDYSHLYPLCAVLDEAIRWACESGASFFNFTGAPGLPTLEKFKSSWGTCREFNWTFEWFNPFWARLASVKDKIGGHLSVSRKKPREFSRKRRDITMPIL